MSATYSAGVQFQIFHEDMDHACFTSVYVLSSTIRMQADSHYFRTLDVCSRGRRTEFTPRTANFADTAYLSRDRWMSSALRTLQNWCKCWKLPIRLAEVRLRHMGSEDDRTGRLGPADHFPNSLFIACPVHALLCKTFGDPSVFQPCRNGGVSKPCTRSYMSRGGLFSGTEGFRTLGSFGLPNARILPKASKKFTKARPIKVHQVLAHHGELVS